MMLRYQNQSGIVLAMVLMIIIVIMIISAAILSQSMNQNKSSQTEMDKVRSDLLAEGMFWNAYSTGSTQPGSSGSQLLNVGVKQYNAVYNTTGAGQYTVDISY
jgi:Tfp pilus assembly protein PilX